MQNYQVNLKAGTQVVAEVAERIENSLIGASVEAEPLVGGATEADAVNIPNGPQGADRKWELAAGKWYKINNVAQQIADGKRWVAWWDHVGASVTLKEMATYAKPRDGQDGQGLLPLFDSSKVGGYMKDAQVRDADGVAYVSLKDNNTSALSIVADWLKTSSDIELDVEGGALSYKRGDKMLNFLGDIEEQDVVLDTTIDASWINNKYVNSNGDLNNGTNISFLQIPLNGLKSIKYEAKKLSFNDGGSASEIKRLYGWNGGNTITQLIGSSVPLTNDTESYELNVSGFSYLWLNAKTDEITSSPIRIFHKNGGTLDSRVDSKLQDLENPFQPDDEILNPIPKVIGSLGTNGQEVGSSTDFTTGRIPIPNGATKVLISFDAAFYAAIKKYDGTVLWVGVPSNTEPTSIPEGADYIISGTQNPTSSINYQTSKLVFKFPERGENPYVRFSDLAKLKVGSTDSYLIDNYIEANDNGDYGKTLVRLVSQMPTGGEVLFGAKQYNFATSGKITKKVNLRGLGGINSLTGTGLSNLITYNNIDITDIATHEGCIVEGLGFSHGGTPALGNSGIRISGRDDSGAWGSNRDSRMYNCSFDNLYNCLHLDNAMGWISSDHVFKKIYNYGYLIQNRVLEDGGDSTIDRNNFNNYNTELIGSGGIIDNGLCRSFIYQIGSGGLRVTNNKFNSHCDVPISGHINHSTSIIMINANSFENYRKLGIDISNDSGFKMKYVVIGSNHFNSYNDSSKAAIRLKNLSVATVMTNVFNNTNQDLTAISMENCENITLCNQYTGYPDRLNMINCSGIFETEYVPAVGTSVPIIL
ncbi:hypothetical protein [Sphingobacterium multivorum]|uniref:hypothetical protein n=1 Tax=Sphingobacterium multivorum TaxID=28454 RepID=UPI00301A0273